MRSAESRALLWALILACLGSCTNLPVATEDAKTPDVFDRIRALDLLPRQPSEPAVPKTNPEELTNAVARATEDFGDEDAAFRWLGIPVAALDYATPISCLATHQGAMRVNDVLTQIEHGVW